MQSAAQRTRQISPGEWIGRALHLTRVTTMCHNIVIGSFKLTLFQHFGSPTSIAMHHIRCVPRPIPIDTTRCVMLVKFFYSFSYFLQETIPWFIKYSLRPVTAVIFTFITRLKMCYAFFVFDLIKTY